MRTYENHCIVVIASTNYIGHTGGTEKFTKEIVENYKHFHKKVIHIFPLKKINDYLETKKTKKRYIGVNYDGNFWGVFLENNIVDVIFTIQEKKKVYVDGVLINHFWGWDLAVVYGLIDNLNLPIKLFIHDYNAICRYMLVKNSMGNKCSKFIDIPNKKRCSGCKYFSDAEKEFQCNNDFLMRIYERVNTICFPSSDILSKWISVFPVYSDKATIRPHYVYEKKQLKKNPNKVIKIAYIGSTLPHKGYKEFIELTHIFENDPLIEWYYFGNEQNIKVVKGNDHIHIEEADYNKNCTEKALKNSNIDIAFLWSKCQESYSYVYYEALAAGCFIITNKYSGNICHEVQTDATGIAFNNLEEVIDFLKDKKCVQKKIYNDNRFQLSAVKPNSNMNTLMFDDCENIVRGKKTHKNLFLSILYKIKLRKILR